MMPSSQYRLSRTIAYFEWNCQLHLDPAYENLLNIIQVKVEASRFKKFSRNNQICDKDLFEIFRGDGKNREHNLKRPFCPKASCQIWIKSTWYFWTCFCESWRRMDGHWTHFVKFSQIIWNKYGHHLQIFVDNDLIFWKCQKIYCPKFKSHYSHLEGGKQCFRIIERWENLSGKSLQEKRMLRSKKCCLALMISFQIVTFPTERFHCIFSLLDVDECVLGLQTCSNVLTQCVNTVGSAECGCINGYLANGLLTDNVTPNCTGMTISVL